MRLTPSLAALALVSAACFGGGEPVASGPVRCPQVAGGSSSFGCAVVRGTVVGPTGVGLDGVTGAVRSSPQCGCRTVPIEVDSSGRFSVTVHRSEARASASSPDTATILVYMGATAAKYPRAVTGDPHFDTTSVRLTYAPVGAEAVVHFVDLRIPLP